MSEPAEPPVRASGVASVAPPGHRRPTTDEEMVRELYVEHGGALLGYALRLLDGDRQRAEDVVQETILRAWRSPDGLNPDRGPVRAWLLTIARNIVIDADRARRSRPAEVGEAALGGLPYGGNEIDQAMVAADVAEVVAQLAPHHREVIVQVYYRGHSVGEAAEVLGVPVGTVKSRTYYALRQLKLALEERGMTPEVVL